MVNTLYLTTQQPTICSKGATWQGDGRLQCGKIIHEEESRLPSDTINGYLVYSPNTYTRERTVNNIETCLSCRWLDSPRAFNFANFVGGIQQVF